MQHTGFKRIPYLFDYFLQQTALCITKAHEMLGAGNASGAVVAGADNTALKGRQV